jgi:hypothetical protein
MAGIFWLAITLCGFVGFTVFIAPDFATRSWVFCLAKWKSLQLKRARLNELNLFALITRLHAAKRDRYIFLIMSSQLAAAVAILGAGIAAAVFGFLESTDILKNLISFNIRFAERIIAAFLELIVSFGLFALFASLSIRLVKRISSIQRKLSNYEEYRRDVIHRWGREEVFKIEDGL